MVRFWASVARIRIVLLFIMRGLILSDTTHNDNVVISCSLGQNGIATSFRRNDDVIITQYASPDVAFMPMGYSARWWPFCIHNFTAIWFNPYRAEFLSENQNYAICTVMSLLEAPCAKTSWRALLFRTILGITGALIVCFDNWWFKQANNSETCFGGHHCDFEQHVPCLAVYVCMNSEWSSYLRHPALLFCVGATIPWQCADSFIWGGQCADSFIGGAGGGDDHRKCS